MPPNERLPHPVCVPDWRDAPQKLLVRSRFSEQPLQLIRTAAWPGGKVEQKAGKRAREQVGKRAGSEQESGQGEAWEGDSETVTKAQCKTARGGRRGHKQGAIDVLHKQGA